MFNNMEGYSLADIAAATGNNDGFGGNNSWWIIILFIFLFSGGYRNGFLGNGAAAATASGVTDGYILTSDFANIERKLDGVNNGLCDGFYAMNTGMLNGFNNIENAVQNSQSAITAALNNNMINEMQNTNAITAQITGLGTQMQQCCCTERYENATAMANLNYNLAQQETQTRQAIADSTAAITANQDANTRSILDFLTQDKIATLAAENQSLKFAASQQAQNNYLVTHINPQATPAYVVPNPYTGQYGYNTCNCGCNA